jgi:predicted NBD/HSP70 family sugar kinase
VKNHKNSKKKKLRQSVIRTLGARERNFATIIRRQGSIGRREIHRLTRIHPTLTGNTIAKLIESGLICEDVSSQSLSSAPRERGRPQVPLRVDADRRVFLGLAISPGQVRLARVDPTGAMRGDEIVHSNSHGEALIDAAAHLLADHIDDAVFSIGVSFTGIVSPVDHISVFSSSVPSGAPVSLEPIYAAAGQVPLILNNDMHAMAVRWLLEHGSIQSDVLLVGISDGQLGASVLIDGRPHRGAVIAANELGHMRLAIATDRCYCGQEGCLERIVSSPQLARFGARSSRTLDAVLANPDGEDAAIASVLSHLAGGIANAANFIQPGRIIIASPMVRRAKFMNFLRVELPSLLLPGIREKIQVDFWPQFDLQSAQNAAWLALADVFGDTFINSGT